MDLEGFLTGTAKAVETAVAGVASTVEQAGTGVITDVINVVEGAKAVVETDVAAILTQLGHAHNALTGFIIEPAIAGEIAVVKTAIEEAILAVVKHISG